MEKQAFEKLKVESQKRNDKLKALCQKATDQQTLEKAVTTCVNMLIQYYGKSESDAYVLTAKIVLEQPVATEETDLLRQALFNNVAAEDLIPLMSNCIAANKSAATAQEQFYFSETEIAEEMRSIRKRILATQTSDVNNPTRTKISILDSDVKAAAIENLTAKRIKQQQEKQSENAYSTRLKVKDVLGRTREELLIDRVIAFKTEHPNGLTEYDA